MKVSVKNLKVGDSFIHEPTGHIYKVTEIFDSPVYRFPGLKEIYPILCDCFDAKTGKRIGAFKLEDDIEEVNLVEDPTKQNKQR